MSSQRKGAGRSSLFLRNIEVNGFLATRNYFYGIPGRWGYLCPMGLKLDPVNPDFPIRTKEWRGASLLTDLVAKFWGAGRQPFNLTQVRRTALIGNDLIRHHNHLSIALRALQEAQMSSHHFLVSNAQQFLHHGPEPGADTIELRRLGAIPKFRKPSPGSFRLRGLPRNPAEQDHTIGELRKYVAEGEMFVCASRGVPLEDEFCASLSTTVAKKLPGRTLSTDKRLIIDVWMVNLRCRKMATGLAKPH